MLVSANVTFIYVYHEKLKAYFLMTVDKTIMEEEDASYFLMVQGTLSLMIDFKKMNKNIIQDSNELKAKAVIKVFLKY